MRSSKSRSRSKSNRSRSVGNIINRVFDSSGPEGKVRGTPQQIIDKYSQLARDATLSNDRVAAENFQQHAEHYTRMLGDAQREMDARREQQEQQQRPQGQQNQNGERRNRDDDTGSDQPRQEQPRQENAPQDQADAAPRGDALPVGDQDGGETGLVETPENKPQPKPRKPRARKPRAPKGGEDGQPQKAKADGGQDTQGRDGSGGGPDVPEAAE